MEDLAWYLPILIFVGRIGDVSLGTERRPKHMMWFGVGGVRK